MNIVPNLKLAISGALFTAAACMAPAAWAKCNECGTVTDVRTVQKQGEASGAGAVIGGVAGGVVGHQIGSGRGNTLATVAGAGAGAYAGHQIEKSQKSKTTYDVTVHLEDGKTRTFSYAQPTSYKVGDRIKVVNNKLTRQQ